MFCLRNSIIRNIFFLTALIICAASVNAAAEEPVRIVYNSGVAPLKFEDETGQPAGLFPDIWRLWAVKTGKQIQLIKKDTFDESLNALYTGEADIHAGIFKSPEREALLCYSEPILKLDYYLFTHPAVRPVHDIEDTRGLIVGIPKGGFTESWVRSKVPAERIAVYDSFTELFKAARKGEVKVFVATELSLFYDLGQNRIANIFAFDKQNPLYSQVYYAASAKKNPCFTESVNNGLATIRKEEREELENRWIFRKSKKIPADFAALLTDEEQIFLSKTESIKVHNESDWAPFNFNENGDPKGFSVDYMSLLAEKIGLDIQFVNYPAWNEFLSMMKSGELDVMLNIVSTPEREKYLKFTKPYTEAKVLLFIRSDMPDIKSIEGLFGKRVAVPKGFYMQEVLKKYPQIQMIPLKDLTESLQALSSGKVDATLGLAPVMNCLIRQRKISNVKANPAIVIADSGTVRLCMAVSAEQPVLAGILEKGMARIIEDEIQGLEEKWLGRAKTPKPSIPLTPEELALLKAHPTLRLGIDPSFAPFEFFAEDGKYMGMAADYMKIISARLGIDLIPEKGLKWVEVIEKIKRGEIDMLPCVGITEERKQYAVYTNSYLNFMRAIITRGDFPVSGLGDLAQKRVGVQKNSSHHGFLKEHSQLEPLLYDTFENALMALSKNETDAVIGNLAVASHVIRKRTLTNLKIGAYASEEIIPLAIAVRKDLHQLVPILNRALASVSPEEHLQIRRRWIDVGTGQPEKPLLNLTGEEQAWIKEHTIIRVSNETDYAPFDFAENRQAAGFSVDYLHLLSEKSGLQFQFVQDTWENLQEMGRQKQIDLLHSLYRTPERMQYLLFTEPYKTVTFAIYVRDDLRGVNAVSDLAGKKIIMVRGDGIIPVLSKMLPNTDFVFCNTYDEAVKLLSLGKVDATVLDSAVANYLIRRNTLTNIKPAGEAVISHENKDSGMYRLAVRNDWPILHTVIQKAMYGVTPEEFANLEFKWFGKTAEKAMISSLTPKEQVFINSSRPLVFSEVNWKPLSITDNPEKYDGMIADYFHIITRRSGLKFVFQKTETDTWAEVLQNYVEGKIDVVPALGKDDKIGREILLSQPFVTFPLVIVTQNNVSYIRDASELNGRKVAAGRGYTSFHFLKNHYPEIELVETDNVEQGLIKVSNGDVFAFVDHMAIAVDSLQRLGMKNLKIAGEAGYRFDHRIGVDPKYPEALSIINKVLGTMTEQEHREIYHRWLNVKYEKSIDYTLVWQILAGAFFFLCVILYWNRKLAKVNSKLHAEISERIRAEDTIKENQKELVKAKEAAEAASRAKSAFLANMSHEIRTPMNSVLGFISLVLDDPITPEKQRKYLNTAYQSSNALLNLINDILDISKLESGRLELENAPFHLHTAVRETVHTLDIVAKSKNLPLELKIHPHVPDNVIGDSVRLKQILMNLLGNAIKFTQKGQVKLEVKNAESKMANGECSMVNEESKIQHADAANHSPLNIHHSTLLFSVSDTGIGIPADRLERIFDPFTQADSSTTRHFGGTGLGTTISRQLVELMGGRVWVESQEGKGSTFYFTVQMGTEEHRDLKMVGSIAKIEKNSAHHFRHCFKILIAEDIEENIMLANIRLKQQGHTVIEARNGREAVEAFQRENPDIILMDVHMPEMDGLEAAKTIRNLESGMQNKKTAASSALKHVPIIALTASVMKEEQELCLNAGMDMVAGKPVDFDQLSETMEKLVPENRKQKSVISYQLSVTRHQSSVGREKNHTDTSSLTTEPVDWKKGMETWQNEEVYKKALLGFARDYETAAEKIRILLESGDRNAAYQTAHALKGVSGNLSVTEVYRIASDLNADVMEKQTDELIPILESLTNALNAAVDFIRQMEASDRGHNAENGTVKQVLDVPALKELFRELLVSFEKYNPEAAEPLLDQLGRFLSPQQIDPILRHLDRFDFDKAGAETVKLAQDIGIE